MQEDTSIPHNTKISLTEKRSVVNRKTPPTPNTAAVEPIT